MGILPEDNTEVARGAAASVTFAIGDPTLATVETRGSTAVVRPVADGDTELIVTDGDREVRTPYDDCVLVMPSKRLYRGQTAVRLGRFVAAH